jgi:hypothetical protein
MAVTAVFRWPLYCFLSGVPRRALLKTFILLHYLYAFLGPIGGLGGCHRHIKGDEMAGLGMGAAALISAVGYLVLRRRSSSDE